MLDYRLIVVDHQVTVKTILLEFQFLADQILEITVLLMLFQTDFFSKKQRMLSSIQGNT